MRDTWSKCDASLDCGMGYKAGCASDLHPPGRLCVLPFLLEKEWESLLKQVPLGQPFSAGSWGTVLDRTDYC